MEQTVDYVIIGAGIAGLTLQYALRGASTVLIDPAPFRYKIGESIIPQHFVEPEVRPLYDRAITLPSATLKVGTVFIDDASVGSFALPPDTDRTLHVAREELEVATADHFGAQITRERVESIDVEQRVVRTDKGKHRARELILDCSGPARLLSRALGIAREVWPVYASWAYHDVIDRDPERFWNAAEGGKQLFHYDEERRLLDPSKPFRALDPARCTVLTQVRDGTWTWQIPLFDSTMLSVGVVSRHGPVSAQEYAAIVEGSIAPVYRTRQRPFDRSGPFNGFHVRNRFAWAADRFAGDGWALIGDAAFFGDPVYSVGTGFATNHALQVGRMLQHGGWSHKHARGHDRLTSHLFERAKRAYDSWYYGRIFSDRGTPTEIQTDFLRGRVFQAQTIGAYTEMFMVSHLQDANNPMSPRHGEDAAADLTPMLEPDAGLVGWELASARVLRTGVELSWSRPDSSPMRVVVERVVEGRQYYRVVGDLGVSYRTETRGKIELEGQGRALIDACVRLVEVHAARLRARMDAVLV